MVPSGIDVGAVGAAAAVVQDQRPGIGALRADQQLLEQRQSVLFGIHMGRHYPQDRLAHDP